MIERRQALKILAGFSAAALATSPASRARAQSFPSKPVRIVTPFPPGSGPDAALRLVSDRLSRKWGQPVLVDNKPGGNGFIAVAAFKQGSTDGHDLIELDSGHITTHPHTFSKLPYDVANDFMPLRMILRTQFFVAVAADSPFKTLDDIVAAARAEPGKVNYGSWFIGSPGHIGALRLQSMTGVQMTHVPYRDFGQLYTAVANKEVDWALGSIASAGSMEQAGKIRFIALAAPARDRLYPNVPCTAESPTLRGYEVSGWAGLFGPHALPAALRGKIAADIAEALAAPEVVERYRTLGYEAPDLDPTAFADLIGSETRGWGEVIQTAHLKLD
jgi:tripartite-type tricarboxylate transporter receptor subunit TctC